MIYILNFFKLISILKIISKLFLYDESKNEIFLLVIDENKKIYKFVI